MQPTVLAHGTAGLAGDGVPGAALYAAVVVGVVLAMVALRARGPAPVGGIAVAPSTADGTEVGPWPGDAMAAPVRVGAQALGVAALALVLAVGWLGSDILGLSPLPILLGSVLWWTLPALSWLLGDWWRMIDPYDALAALVDRLRGRAPLAAGATADGEADEASDWWLPAALLASFAWLLTCWPDGLRPRSLALWVTALTVLMVGGALVGGRRWVRRSSPLAVVGGALAAASPVAWDHGRIRLRSPLRGLAGRAGGRRSLAVLVVVLGATVWEATAGTQWWVDLAGTGGTTTSTVWSTIGLAWAVLVVGATWMAVARLAEEVSARTGGRDLHEPLVADLALVLGPLAAGAVLGHQLPALLVDGQNLWALASDPFAQGWDLFGTTTHRTDHALLTAGLQSWLQVGLLTAGLGLMLVAGWDRLAARLGPAVLRVGWVMAAWTAVAGGVALQLLLGA